MSWLAGHCVWLCSALWLGGMCFPASAWAQVTRFALIVGNDRGQADEAELRYAAADAHKVHATLRDVGDFDPFNMVLLEGGSAENFRRSLIDLNDRIRSARSQSGGQIVLFVYYSGHADSQDLHLGDSRFSIAELSQLVRGSAADFRLLILDACRSGTLTRGKGGRVTRPFDIPPPARLNGEGLAFLTASADHELAQESDEIRGSFFTHALVSGLLGAADRDRDGNVVLDEAYHYAYENTLRASSRSSSGLQHPTFFYDLRGQGQLVLTRPFAIGHSRGTLELPPSAAYLVFRGDAHGQVSAEVGAGDPVRRLSLTPGAYFVRGRAKSHVLEGNVVVHAEKLTRVDPDALTRIEYARLVRKGQDALTRSHALEVLGGARLPLPNADTLCYGAHVGYKQDLPSLTWLVRAGGCGSSLSTEYLRARVLELDLVARVARTFDLGTRTSIDVGVGLGGVYFSQRFETAGRAPTRHSWAALGELVLGLNVDVSRAGYVVVEGAFQTYLLPMFDAESRKTSTRAALPGRLGLGAGLRF